MAGLDPAIQPARSANKNLSRGDAEFAEPKLRELRVSA
jgi:hypothetical protein